MSHILQIISQYFQRLPIGSGGSTRHARDMELPRWIIFLCVPLGSYLMCFRFLQVAWAFFWTGELPHHDPGHVEGVDEGAVAPRGVAR